MSKEARKADIALRLKVVQEGLWPSCLSCTAWREHTEVDCATGTWVVQMRCSRYSMIPPVETIIVGCIHYEQDIPF